MFANRRVGKNHWRINLLLLFCIVFLFIVGPAFISYNKAKAISFLFLTILIISGVSAADYRVLTYRILQVIGVIALIIMWLEVFYKHELLQSLSLILISLIFTLITIALITQIASSRIVTADVLLSAVNGYLLIGIVGALLFAVIDMYNPHSLSQNMTDRDGISEYVYFSYVTLTTLGYGELVPVSKAAKALSILLSISGPLYLSILIAMLIGKFQNQKYNDA